MRFVRTARMRDGVFAMSAKGLRRLAYLLLLGLILYVAFAGGR